MLFGSLSFQNVNTSEESQRTSSHITPRVIAVRSPAMTASYSASLLNTRKPRVKDCSIMDPSRVVRTILILPPCCLMLHQRSGPILQVGRVLCGSWGEVSDEVGQYLAFD